MNPFELIYYIGHSLGQMYRLRTQRSLPARVVSVGNITVGGTGKTPATIALAEEAARRGLAPVVLTRGYRGKKKGPCFVSTGKGPLLSPDEAGDEPVVMAERLAGIPIVKCADRYSGGVFALENLRGIPRSSFLFLLDDGFQHTALRRNIDIVLVDGSSPFAGNRLLPSGRLREPITSLKRSHFLVITKVRNETVAHELRQIHPDGRISFSEYRTRGFREPGGGLLPPDSLKNSSVYAFCGIARPESFRRTMTPLCDSVRGFKAFRDHHPYSRRDLDLLRKDFRKSGADFLVTTEKDAVKLREEGAIERFLVLQIDFRFDADFFDDFFARLT